MVTNRRAVLGTLASLGSLGVAGCAGSDNETSAAADTATESETATSTQSQTSLQQDRTTTTPESVVLFDDTVTLGEGESTAVDFSVSAPVQVSYSVTVADGIEIDLFVVTLSNYQQYQSDQAFTAVETVSETTTATGGVEVSRGNYYVILDHTRKGPTSPPDALGSVPAEITAEISYQKK